MSNTWSVHQITPIWKFANTFVMRTFTTDPELYRTELGLLYLRVPLHNYTYIWLSRLSGENRLCLAHKAIRWVCMAPYSPTSVTRQKYSWSPCFLIILLLELKLTTVLVFPIFYLIFTQEYCGTGLWPQEMRYNLELVTTPSTVWISRMGPGLHALPVFSVLCRLASYESGSLKWWVKTRTHDNRQSNQSCHQDLTGWPQQCLSIMRQRGLSGEKKGKEDEAARQGGGKQKYKSRENRKQKNEEPTMHRGGRRRMKDRSMYNRLMK